MDFDKGLGAYPMENHSQWQGLSNYISTQVIQKIESLNSIIMSEEEERQRRGKEDSNINDAEGKPEADLDETMEAL